MSPKLDEACSGNKKPIFCIPFYLNICAAVQAVKYQLFSITIAHDKLKQLIIKINFDDKKEKNY